MMKSNSYYPVFLNLNGIRCLVAGGGTIAQRKTVALLEAGADVTLVSPTVTSELQQLHTCSRITWIQDFYREKYMDTVQLVISATNDSEVNKIIYADACRRSVFVNVVDDPPRCSFIVPAAFKKGDIQLAVCTGGGAPCIAGRLRDQLSESISDASVALVSVLKKNRDVIKKLTPEKKHEFWRTIRTMNLEKFGADSDLENHICMVIGELNNR